MKPGTFMLKRKFLIVLGLKFLIVFLLAGQSFAGTAKEINASVDPSMKRFHKQVKDAAQVVRQAEGMLVLPDVKKGAFIVGGEYGQGALLIGGKTVDYYADMSLRGVKFSKLDK